MPPRGPAKRRPKSIIFFSVGIFFKKKLRHLRRADTCSAGGCLRQRVTALWMRPAGWCGCEQTNTVINTNVNPEEQSPHMVIRLSVDSSMLQVKHRSLFFSLQPIRAASLWSLHKKRRERKYPADCSHFSGINPSVRLRYVCRRLFIGRKVGILLLRAPYFENRIEGQWISFLFIFAASAFFHWKAYHLRPGTIKQPRPSCTQNAIWWCSSGECAGWWQTLDFSLTKWK